MRKSLILIFTLLLIFLLIGCNDTPPEQENGLSFEQNQEEAPDVNDAQEDLPDRESEQGETEPGEEEAPEPSGKLKVHFIDVGQGDAILIQTPTQSILIDGGDRGNTSLNYIRDKGVSSLDLVIGTHPHADHIGGLINV